MVKYKTKDTKSIKEFKEYLNSNVDNNEKNNDWEYFKANIYITDLFNYLREVTNKEKIQVSRGNCLSNVMIIIDDLEENSNVLVFFRTIITKLNKKFHNIYFAPKNKSSLQYENNYVLECEMNYLKPKYILSFANISGRNIKSNSQVVFLDIKDFNEMYSLMNKDILQKDEKEKLLKLKTKLWAKIKQPLTNI